MRITVLFKRNTIIDHADHIHAMILSCRVGRTRERGRLACGKQRVHKKPIIAAKLTDNENM